MFVDDALFLVIRVAGFSQLRIRIVPTIRTRHVHDDLFVDSGFGGCPTFISGLIAVGVCLHGIVQTVFDRVGRG